jgi:hypothetical protein
MITGQPSNQNYGFNKAIRLLHVFKEYIYIMVLAILLSSSGIKTILKAQ